MRLFHKPLRDMAAEVRKVNEKNGWHETDRTFGEGIALLHSEVSEAFEAFRDHGLEDTTGVSCSPQTHAAASVGERDHVCKPEGVGSEFADVLIRCLDEADRCGLDLDDIEWQAQGIKVTDYGTSFGDSVTLLHRDITKVDVLRGSGVLARHFAALLARLVQTAAFYGVRLEAEYERKLAYNATRGYRHGGKRL